jgi:hypothetical protein
MEMKNPLDPVRRVGVDCLEALKIELGSSDNTYNNTSLRNRRCRADNRRCG